MSTSQEKITEARKLADVYPEMVHKRQERPFELLAELADALEASVSELAAANAVIAEVRVQVDACRSMVVEHLMPPAAEPTVDLIVRGLSGILDGNKTVTEASK